MLLMQSEHCSVEEQFLLQMPVLYGSWEDPGNWRQFPPFRVFLWILEDCKASLTMSWPMGTGYKAASSSFPACATRENTCVLSQAVLTGFAFGLESNVRLLTCISSPSLVRWERMSHNSSHSKMCAAPARATTTARRWQKTACSSAVPVPSLPALKPGEKKEEKLPQCMQATRQANGV